MTDDNEQMSPGKDLHAYDLAVYHALRDFLYSDERLSHE